MLFKSLMRPVANAVCKIPTRSTSAVIGPKCRHVSVTVSVDFWIVPFLISFIN